MGGDLYVLDIVKEAARVQIVADTVQYAGLHGLGEHAIDWALAVLHPDVLEHLPRFIIPASADSVATFVVYEMPPGALSRVLGALFIWLLVGRLFTFLRKHFLINDLFIRFLHVIPVKTYILNFFVNFLFTINYFIGGIGLDLPWHLYNIVFQCSIFV